VAVCESQLVAESLVAAADAAGLSNQHEISIATFDNRGAVLRDISDESAPA
jgi:DNA-binding LacI/PurR family transcriptional regulator